MAKNYTNMAEQIIKNVGGVDNVLQLTHCVTRLRFQLKDYNIANRDIIKDIDGVLSIVEGNNQFQIVVGDEVEYIYDAINKKYRINDFSSNQHSKNSSKNIVINILNKLTVIFNPIVTALAGAGMLKALLVILSTYNFLATTDSTYKILSAAGNSVFYFLPLFLAISCAKAFNCNIFISLGIAASLMEPNFTSLIKNNGDIVNFFMFPVVLMSYSGTLIPAIISIYVYSKLEIILKKIIPKSLELFLSSMIALMIMVPLTIMVIGPIGVFLGDAVGNIINVISNKSGLFAGALIGGSWTLLVMLGIHWGVVPIMVNNISRLGFDVIRPMIAAATFASSGAAFGVFLKSKNKKTKAFALSSLLPSLLGGITEPIIYGISIKYKKPFVAQIIAGTVAGAFLGATKTKAIVYVFPALTTLPAFFGDTFKFYCIGISISFFLSAIITYILGFDEIETLSVGKNENKISESIKNGVFELKSCVNGDIIELKDVKDEAFSSKSLGDGLAFIPSDGIIKSPFDSIVDALPSSKHAIGLSLDCGIELLIHIGIDTVNLQGRGFEVLVKEGDRILQGQDLIKFDIETLIKENYDTTVIMVITNMDKVKNMNIKDKSMFIEI